MHPGRRWRPVAGRRVGSGGGGTSRGDRRATCHPSAPTGKEKAPPKRGLEVGPFSPCARGRRPAYDGRGVRRGSGWRRGGSCAPRCVRSGGRHRQCTPVRRTPCPPTSLHAAVVAACVARKAPQWGLSFVERPPENGPGVLGRANSPDFLWAMMVEWSFVMQDEQIPKRQLRDYLQWKSESHFGFESRPV